MEAVWSAALPVLQQRLGVRNFNAWIAPIQCACEAEELRLEVPSKFSQEWITRYFLSTIQETVREIAGHPYTVLTVVHAANGSGAPAVERHNGNGAAGDGAKVVARKRSPKIGRLVSHYRFDTFVVGSANEVAYRAAQAVTASPGRSFNPVFLHGGVGLGKTHLINAIGHGLLSKRSRLRLACLSAEAFTNTMVGSLLNRKMDQFRDRFRRVDALILDDVQFLAGKERTQEEFFYTFNTLYESGKQIVLTSDKPPSAIAKLGARLRSRFEGGLIADIFPPTREMRLAIVKAKANARGVDLPEAAAEILVDRSGSTVRELEGALTRVAASSAVRGLAITRELAEEAVTALGNYQRAISVEFVQKTVSRYFGISVAELRSAGRERRLVFPRQVAMYLSRTLARETFPCIGEKFGGRDHSTVMHAVRTVEKRSKSDRGLAQVLTLLGSFLRR